MLHYMYEHFIDKFEWFARADDDVFMRTDKLEHFLRSIDSSKPQFIGEYQFCFFSSFSYKQNNIFHSFPHLNQHINFTTKNQEKKQILLETRSK